MAMEKTVIKVTGMSCEHCVKSIRKAVGSLEGVAGVEVNLDGKTVSVEYDPEKAGLDVIKQAIDDQGYEVE